MSLRAGIDVGGTFTDITVLDESSGVIKEVKKVPSNPRQPLVVLEKVLADLEQEWGASSISYVLHGSTHALNALLEEKGGVTGVLMTRGFRDVYEIGRQWRGEEVFNILYPGPKRFVPRRLIAEVDERLDCDGRVVAPLDTDSLNRALDELQSQGIDALAIVFLFSYVNNAHERKAAELVRKRFPHVFVSLSSEVNPMWREYERTCTTVLNAYLGPSMMRYFSQLEETVRGHFPSAHSLVMKSNGGVGTPSYVAKYPIHTLMSGPVAGVVAAHRLGAAKRIENLISLDIGGTSSDMALIPESRYFAATGKSRVIPRAPIPSRSRAWVPAAAASRRRVLAASFKSVRTVRVRFRGRRVTCAAASSRPLPTLWSLCGSSTLSFSWVARCRSTASFPIKPSRIKSPGLWE
jgi:N-methylhydantoinase A